MPSRSLPLYNLGDLRKPGGGLGMLGCTRLRSRNKLLYAIMVWSHTHLCGSISIVLLLGLLRFDDKRACDLASVVFGSPIPGSTVYWRAGVGTMASGPPERVLQLLHSRRRWQRPEVRAPSGAAFDRRITSTCRFLTTRIVGTVTGLQGLGLQRRLATKSWLIQSRIATTPFFQFSTTNGETVRSHGRAALSFREQV